MIRLIAFCLIFITVNIFAGGRAQSTPLSESPRSESREISPLPEQSQQSRAEQVMKALTAAYPQRIEKVEYRNGDWAVFLESKWFYYASGRLMPEDLLYMAEDYNPQSFYNYTSELPPWREPSQEQADRFRNMANNRSANPPRRSQHFFDALWRAHSHEESYRRVKSIRFLGNPVMVHYLILADLSLVEEYILEAAETDPQVRTWRTIFAVLTAGAGATLQMYSQDHFTHTARQLIFFLDHWEAGKHTGSGLPVTNPTGGTFRIMGVIIRPKR